MASQAETYSVQHQEYEERMTLHIHGTKAPKTTLLVGGLHANEGYTNPVEEIGVAVTI
jgi:hypothetical protein